MSNLHFVEQIPCKTADWVLNGAYLIRLLSLPHKYSCVMHAGVSEGELK